MCPQLFSIGPFPIYSFGLMMGIGFFTASLVLHQEAVRKNMMLDFSAELLAFLRIAYVTIVAVLIASYLYEYGVSGLSKSFETNSLKTTMILAGMVIVGYVLFNKKSREWVTADTSALIVVISIIAGVSGSKLLFVIESFSAIARGPVEMIFSPGGLTWYGGFTLVTISIYFITKKKGVPFLQVCDLASPALMIGYGIARIGCHLAGDGDYGMPTNLPWGTEYSLGTYPPSVAFRDFPEVVKQYGVNGIVPDTIHVHPTPVYEFLAAVALFFVLWKFRKTLKRNGELFMLYLIFAGGARFLVEFIRLNPRILFGLSEAQLFSIVMILGGVIGFLLLRNRPQASPTTAAA